MDDGADLENRFPRKRIRGSNPLASAIYFYSSHLIFLT